MFFQVSDSQTERCSQSLSVYCESWLLLLNSCSFCMHWLFFCLTLSCIQKKNYSTMLALLASLRVGRTIPSPLCLKLWLNKDWMHFLLVWDDMHNARILEQTELAVLFGGMSCMGVQLCRALKFCSIAAMEVHTVALCQNPERTPEIAHNASRACVWESARAHVDTCM